jgi:hypothetical protein
VLKRYQPFWQRSETLPKWDITILPSWWGAIYLHIP